MDIIVCIKQNVDMKQIRIKRDTREAVVEGLPLLFGRIRTGMLWKRQSA